MLLSSGECDEPSQKRSRLVRTRKKRNKKRTTEFAKKLFAKRTSTRRVRQLIRAHAPHSFRHLNLRAQTDRFTRTRTRDDESGLGFCCVNPRRRCCRARGIETKKNILVVSTWPPRLEWRRSSPPRRPRAIGRDSGQHEQRQFLIQRTIGGVRRRRNDDDDDHEQDDEESLATRA